MKETLPIIANKAWSLMRAIIFMLKKNISKSTFLADLNIMIKRGKIAGKVLHKLFFHHHHRNWVASTTFHFHSPPPHEYDDIDEKIIINPKALEMLTTAATSPVVKHLRITDSPFPLGNADGDGMVDEAAEKFIMRFYDGLRRQK